ncbi:adenylyl-sulfate kinase [Chondromyces apiculatus]|uniref:Adenylyl-sulfate kinase n=1 Tax=Chondromyces apiculatus DSM 436 TaxID=1192034 RepID=A0A017TID7_9BACT|nr:adenylyl-sulfate kinase [Chondromyces apiculatus]EYF08595.1 Sulfate adenylyltransferase, dissimilatory-type [Chondromyces apiculatus DSM 436]
MAGFVVWFTGLSGTGKSTLAAMLSAELRARGVHVEVLDGDEVRTHLSRGLGFSREDRDTNVRRIGFVAKLLARAGSCAITAAISPYRQTRDEQRAQIPGFVEIHCDCALDALAERDPKGLYKKALAGEITHFTGVDDPYERPEHPELVVHTDREAPEASLARILVTLEDLGHIPRRQDAPRTTPPPVARTMPPPTERSAPPTERSIPPGVARTSPSAAPPAAPPASPRSAPPGAPRSAPPGAPRSSPPGTSRSTSPPAARRTTPPSGMPLAAPPSTSRSSFPPAARRTTPPSGIPVSAPLPSRLRHDVLLPPHGGELTPCYVDPRSRESLAARAETLPIVDLDACAEHDLHLLATGAYAPLRGFMTSRDYLRVVRDLRLERGLPWALPITLATTEEAAAPLRVGVEAALRARDGRLVALLDVTDIYRPDKDLEARALFGTTDPEHPGVAALHQSGPVYLGGAVHAFDRPVPPDFPAREHTPAETRAHFADRGFRHVTGYLTRDPLDRAHEYLTKAAMELCDDLLLHALVDAPSPDDFPAPVRMRCHEALLAHYYPQSRVLLSVYPAPLRAAGARDLLHHALVLKNHGCSHVLIAPDHPALTTPPSDARPSESRPGEARPGEARPGEARPGEARPEARAIDEARAVFQRFAPAELGIVPLFVEPAFHSTALGTIATAKTSPGDASTRLHLTPVEVRAMLQRGQLPPPEILRPEVARLLADATVVRLPRSTPPERDPQRDP